MFKRNQLHSILSMVDNSTIFSLIIISTITSILFLVIPVAAQTLVNFIAFGHVLRPVFILSIMVLVLIVCAGALGLWHNILIEIIQQKLMVHVGLSVTKRFSDLSYNGLIAHDTQRELNKFFDIIVIMKSLAGLLSYGIGTFLQVFFGLILLVIYHPYFVIFDAFVVVSLAIIILGPFRVAKKMAHLECKEKHNIAGWFDEIFINRYLFKFADYAEFLMKETDNRLVAFLKVRNRHFRQLIKHQVGFFILAAVASSILLGLGGYLVIANQLSLGQLVASEIIMGGIIYSLKQSVGILDDYYDLSASLEKFDDLLSLPIEEKDPMPGELISIVENLENVNLMWKVSGKKIIATPDEPLLIRSINNTSIENVLTNLIGLKDDPEQQIIMNGFQCNQKLLIALRRRSILLQEPQWFAGTIYDNIVLNAENVSMDFILENITKLGLTDKIMGFTDGLLTYVSSWQHEFTEQEAILLMVLRAVINSPSLIIIDRTLDSLEKDLIAEVLAMLLSDKEKTLVIATQRQDFASISNTWELS